MNAGQQEPSFTDAFEPIEVPSDLGDRITNQFNVVQKSYLLDEQEIDTLEDALNRMQEIKKDMDEYVGYVESIDLLIDILSYKQYESTYEYTSRMEEIKNQQSILLSSDLDKSELAIQLAELDQALLENKLQHDTVAATLNEQKIEVQTKYELVVQALDTAFDALIRYNDKSIFLLEAQKVGASTSQMIIADNNLMPILDQFGDAIMRFKGMQLTGWRNMHSEEKIANLLETKGLKITKSGHVLTKFGEIFTIKDAFDKGLLSGMGVDWTKYFAQMELPSPSEKFDSASSTSVSSKMSNEDINYLKETVGKPLTFALAEITAKHPKDPVHYLAHWLFKYRYNCEITAQNEEDLKKLTAERDRLAAERWKKFIESEAKAAVMDIVIEAENIAIFNELQRIEQETALLEEAYNEELNDEARDQLGEYNGPPVGSQKNLP